MASVSSTQMKVWLDGVLLQAFKAELSTDQEWIDVRTMAPPMKPDPAWEYNDAAGHYHAFTNSGKLPTLERFSVHVPCDGFCDPECEGFDEYAWRCKLCQEEIQPGMKPDYNDPQRIPGQKTWNVELETPEALPLGVQHSVKIQLGDRVYFGVVMMLPRGLEMDGINPPRHLYTLMGGSELGERRG